MGSKKVWVAIRAALFGSLVYSRFEESYGSAMEVKPGSPYTFVVEMLSQGRRPY